MNPEQIRARLAEIAAMLEGIQAGADGYTQEQIDETENLNAEFEKLSAQLTTAEKIEAMKTKAAAPAGRKTNAAAPQQQTQVQVGASATDRFGGFKSSGEFLQAVRAAGVSGKPDERLLKNAIMKESVGEDGGFLVPEEISTTIMKKMEGDESLMERTTKIQVSSNNLTVSVDENQPWNGGVQAYWLAEGAQFTESKPNFKQPSWRLQKLGAIIKATDELLEDAVALESYIKNAAPAAMMHQINKAILTGDGVGKPQGIINSPFTVTVAKESMQTADTINTKNVVKMYNRMFPGSRANAAWYINPAAEDQLRLLKDDNDNYIYLSPGSQMNQSPYGTLMGRPVIPLMAGIPALGDLGDIIFADLSYYWMIRKAGGVKSATSIHLHFDREITSFRFSLRVDGKAPFTSPVTTEYGNFTMSAFVILEAR